MVDPMALQLEAVDLLQSSEEVSRAIHALHLARDQERIAGDYPEPFEEFMARWTRQADFMVRPMWVARIGGEILGTAVLWLEYREENRENCDGWIYVRADKRGLGVGRALTGVVLDRAVADGRIRIATEVKDGSTSEGFVRMLGLDPRYYERKSRLLLSEVDRDLLESWTNRAGERASGYELLLWEGSVPHEFLDAWCDLMFFMNTAPREDYIEDDEIVTPTMWREIERLHRDRSQDLWVYVARDKKSGDLAGLTSVSLSRLWPEHAEQEDTMVHPDHRGQGLGRWLKAAMLKRILAERPEAVFIDTNNADSNQPMVEINVELGFRPVLMLNVWQGDIAEARERLDTSS